MRFSLRLHVPKRLLQVRMIIFPSVFQPRYSSTPLYFAVNASPVLPQRPQRLRPPSLHLLLQLLHRPHPLLLLPDSYKPPAKYVILLIQPSGDVNVPLIQRLSPPQDIHPEWRDLYCRRVSRLSIIFNRASSGTHARLYFCLARTRTGLA